MLSSRALCKSTRKVQPSSFKFFSDHSEASLQHSRHQSDLLLLGVRGAGFVVHLIVCVDSPRTHREAELNVSLDFASMSCAVKKSKLNGTLGKERMKIDSMVPGRVVMLMIYAATISVVNRAVPYALKAAGGFADVFFEGLKQFGRHLLAPTVCTILNFKSLVKQILSANRKVDKP